MKKYQIYDIGHEPLDEEVAMNNERFMGITKMNLIDLLRSSKSRGGL